MSDKSVINIPSKRRAFLQKSCVAAVSGAALGVASSHVLAASEHTVQVSPETSPEHKGYRLTQHVLDYYKTAAL